jgi:hypothetical protein
MEYVVLNIGGYLTVLPISTVFANESPMYTGTKEDCFKYADSHNRNTIAVYGYHKSDNISQPNCNYNR